MTPTQKVQTVMKLSQEFRMLIADKLGPHDTSLLELEALIFTLFTSINEKVKNKVVSQVMGIEENLAKNKQNYFVNTAGFNLLMSEINKVN
jgi:hypothetical protein